ncbi:uncharacterized protein [Nicotiana tomentosiformis]|uniref:uncharacterized protein n=1 Tax=Nicotiana tomentosiformis TaxID=4098 RepID=UPI00051B4D76|nr:uncharacterized protein LOC104113067 isoform X1 [Nicotiana tomentosiformis]
MTMMESNSSMNPLHGFFDIESMSHHVFCMFCGFTATRKDGRSDSHGKGTLTLFYSFPTMVALSFLVSCCKFNPLHVDRIYPLKYDQNYLRGSSAGLSLVFG